MSRPSVTERELRKELAAWRARLQLAMNMLVAAGYAMIGGPWFEALAKSEPLKVSAYAWLTAGLAALMLALYFAPAVGGRANDG